MTFPTPDSYQLLQASDHRVNGVFPSSPLKTATSGSRRRRTNQRASKGVNSLVTNTNISRQLGQRGTKGRERSRTHRSPPFFKDGSNHAKFHEREINSVFMTFYVYASFLTLAVFIQLVHINTILISPQSITNDSFIRFTCSYRLPRSFFFLPSLNKQSPTLPRWSNASKTTLKDAQTTSRSHVVLKASTKRPFVQGGLSSIVFPVITVPGNGNRFGGSIPPSSVAFLGERYFRLLSLCLVLIDLIFSYITHEITNGRIQAFFFSFLYLS